MWTMDCGILQWNVETMVFLSLLHFTISAHSSDTVLCGLHTKYRGNNSCLWMALLGRRIWPSLEKMLHEIFLPGHWPLGSLMMSQYGPGAKISHSTDSSVQCPRSAVARIDVQGDYSSGARGRPGAWAHHHQLHCHWSLVVTTIISQGPGAYLCPCWATTIIILILEPLEPPQLNQPNANVVQLTI